VTENIVELPSRGSRSYDVPPGADNSASVNNESETSTQPNHCLACGQALFLTESPFDGSALARTDSLFASPQADVAGSNRRDKPDEQIESPLLDATLNRHPFWQPSVTGAEVIATLRLIDACSDYQESMAALWITDSEVVQPGVAESGDSFYIRLRFRQNAKSVCMNFNAIIHFGLPDGLEYNTDDPDRKLRTWYRPSASQSWEEWPGTYMQPSGIRRLTLTPQLIPQWRMHQDNEYTWFIPFKTASPLSFPEMVVTLEAIPRVDPKQVWTRYPIYSGNPDSHIWKYYEGRNGGNFHGSYWELGVPTDAESLIPWSHPRAPSTPVGTMQSFRAPRSRPRTPDEINWLPLTLTWSPVYGVQEIWTNYREIWLQHIDRLGPARSKIDYSNSRIHRQEYAGGYIFYDAFTEETKLGGIYCWDDPKWC
jgi:hypothetical protein